MSEDDFSATDAKVWRVRRRLARWAASAALGLCVGPVALTVGSSALHQAGVIGSALPNLSFAIWFFAWVGGVPLASLVSILASRPWRQSYGEVEVKGGNLHMRELHGERVVPRGRIQGALIKPEERGPSEVELTLDTGDSLHVQAGGREEHLARALGFGGPLRRTVISLGEARQPLQAVWIAAVAGFFSTCGTGLVGAAALSLQDWGSDLAWYALGLLFILSTTLLARRFAPGRLVVGTDGVVFEGPFRKRFFPRAAIEDVLFVGKDLALIVRKGDLLEQVDLTAEGHARKDALFYRIREVLALPEGGGSRTGAAVLLRANEPIAAWRERLRKLAVSGSGYRTGGLAADVLLKTATDATAPAAARLGAAAAIAFGDDEEAKKEVRIATEGIANDRLRIAMTSAAEGMAEEEAISAALEAEEKAQRL